MEFEYMKKLKPIVSMTWAEIAKRWPITKANLAAVRKRKVKR